MKRWILSLLLVMGRLLPLLAQQPVTVRLVVEPDSSAVAPFRGQLLNVTFNNYIRCSFLFEQDSSGMRSLILLQAASAQKHTLPAALPTEMGKQLGFLFNFSERDSSCTVWAGGDSCRFERVSLNQRNLRFNPLPDGQTAFRLVSFEVLQQPAGRPAWPVILLIAAIVLGDLALFAFLYLQRHRRQGVKPQQPVPVSARRYVTSPRNTRCGIYLFGGLRVLAEDGNDITARFTPIVKELLLLLICHTPKGGVSSEQIKTTLWYDKDEKSALNNRSVSLFKLRGLLRGVGDFAVRNEQGRWRLEASVELVDYYRFIDLVKTGQLTPCQMDELLTLVERGPLLEGFDEIWADTLKADVTDAILSVLTRFALGLDLREQADLLLDVCEAITKFDSLNETALALRCKVYREKGNAILSRQIFTNFQKEYQAVYGEPFSREYADVISA